VKPPDTFSGGGVVLRKLRESDRAAVLTTMRDAEVQRWLNMPGDPRDADFDTLLRTVDLGFSSGDRFDYTVATSGDDTPFGAVVASRRARDNWELAYLAREAGRGRGLMTRAVGLIAKWLFEQNVGRIELRTHPENIASQRLAARCGFQREGVERKSIWLHGRRVDAIVWSLLPDDLV
jgi:RimJ/RimL family protein N-acetyltransferase